MTTIPNGGKDPQRGHEIGGSMRTSRASRPQNTPGQAPQGPSGPSLEVSAQGERFVSLRARLDGIEIARAERVERLRQALAAGRYQVDSEAVAAAMLAELVEQLMTPLDERDRQVLTLRLQGHQIEEISSLVGCTERTVRRVLGRIKQRLQHHQAGTADGV